MKGFILESKLTNVMNVIRRFPNVYAFGVMIFTQDRNYTKILDFEILLKNTVSLRFTQEFILFGCRKIHANSDFS